ncbi:MlaD family protein [Mycolicibacterium elephantis]|uniref:MCE family protein n=1 Tax=Mycolicibacterium elephantis TaxID=81858 RepID=UPI0007EAFB74|nr:MlaD family protein [Mycolicibacterium elephantis]OBA66150.1 virulence factor Mce [Mycolicibacterium elephantis]OBE93280.1 virulence factor Mce [Mycolicibacterium elephantis]
MLTRFVRNQLIVFVIAAVVGVSLMLFNYMQVPTLLGIGRITVKLELAGTGGLYRFANVTYRGVQVGKVVDVRPTRDGAVAMLSLDKSPRIPATAHANVRSVSAVGEQYVDLTPDNGDGPYLEDGSVIPEEQTSIPQAVGPMLDQLSALVDSVPKDRISALLDESFKGLDGTGYDLGSLFDSSATVVSDGDAVADRTRTLIDDSRPLLDGQAQSADAIRTWARSVAGITGQLAANDPQIRTVLEVGPDAADEASRLFNQVKATLPVLLANLTTIGKVGVTYHASLEQLLVLFPPYVAATQTVGVSRNNPTGMALGDFTMVMNDPPACTVGFLPPSEWRSPEDETIVDTPDGLYCKLPQDSPIGVRGARNYPCMGQPGKRAPTVEICESDQPFEPLAMRQHPLGPYPIDPNLIAQGVPPDDRVDFGDRIHAPIEGTPVSPPAPTPAEPSGADDPVATPSSNRSGGSEGPSVAFATYDPRTGQYATPDGMVFRQGDLVTPAGPRPWTELLTAGSR